MCVVHWVCVCRCSVRTNPVMSTVGSWDVSCGRVSVLPDWILLLYFANWQMMARLAACLLAPLYTVQLLCKHLLRCCFSYQGACITHVHAHTHTHTYTHMHPPTTIPMHARTQGREGASHRLCVPCLKRTRTQSRGSQPPAPAQPSLVSIMHTSLASSILTDVCVFARMCACASLFALHGLMHATVGC